MGYALIGVVVPLIFAALKYNSLRSVDLKATHTLRLNKFYWYLGLVCILLGIVISIIIVNSVVEESLSVIFMVLLFLIGAGLVLAISYQNHKVQFDNNQITVTSFFGKLSQISWKDIDSVHFSAFSGYIILKGMQSNKLKIHFHIIGLHDLLNLIGQRSPNVRGQIDKVRLQLKK